MRWYGISYVCGNFDLCATDKSDILVTYDNSDGKRALTKMLQLRLREKFPGRHNFREDSICIGFSMVFLA